MTREEEILEAARTRAEKHHIAEMELYAGDKCNYSYGRIYDSEIASFEAGAKYADDYPKSPWISVNDDLPYNHEELINPKDKTETIPVLANIGGIIGITKMVKNSHTCEWIWAAQVTVYHWIPIPNLPKE